MRVLLISSWGTACGIADYAEQAKRAIEKADPGIEIVPYAAGLNPSVVEQLFDTPHNWDVIWLNHHRGLHSRWTPKAVAWAKTRGKVLITFHDTFGENPPDDLCQQLHDLADAFVVHEPCVGLEKQILIRHGVPEIWLRQVELSHFKAYPDQPLLGTVGFNFPWKNFDRIAEYSEKAGWALLILSNNATEKEEARWRRLNPHLHCVRKFLPQWEAVSYLAACDATIFAYECANSGTSGAIRQGLAARKPVIAWQCRQFRDLNTYGGVSIHWCRGFDHLEETLWQIPIQRVDPGIAYLAHRDSWTNQGKKYAEIFRRLA